MSRPVVTGKQGWIYTFAGGGQGDNGPAPKALVYQPYALVTDAAGNLYFTDFDWRVREVTADGIMHTIAGNGAPGFSGDGGRALRAEFEGPLGIAVDHEGNVYVADGVDNRVRRIDKRGIITTIAGGKEIRDWQTCQNATQAINACLGYPDGLAVDAADNLYISGNQSDVVWKVVLSTGTITRFAGTGTAGTTGDGGPAIQAELNWPSLMTFDRKGDLLISTRGALRSIDPSGIIHTVAGNGQCCAGRDAGPEPPEGAIATQVAMAVLGPAVDAAGNVYVADPVYQKIRRIDARSGRVTTFAGSGDTGHHGDGGPAVRAQFNGPFAVAIGPTGTMYVADYGNDRIRMIDAHGTIHTAAGTGWPHWAGDGGLARYAALGAPQGLAIDAAGNVFIADMTNNRIRRVDGRTGLITTLAGTGYAGFSGDGGPATKAKLNGPTGVAVDTRDNVYIADSGNNRIRRIDSATGAITTVAGNGFAGYSGDDIPATRASLNDPASVVVDQAGNMYIADSDNHRIRKVNTAGITSTLAGTGTSGFSGDGGPATAATLSAPGGLALGPDGDLFISDASNNRVRRVSQGVISTVAGDGDWTSSGDQGQATSAGIPQPGGIVVTPDGSMFIEAGGYVRRVSPAGLISTVAGDGRDDLVAPDGVPATTTQLVAPFGLAADAAGNLYISDAELQSPRVRVVVGIAKWGLTP